jgi:hypothetical protein
LDGASTCAITCSDSRRDNRGGRRGVSPAKNPAVVGRVGSQSCCRIARKKVLRQVTAASFVVWLSSSPAIQARYRTFASRLINRGVPQAGPSVDFGAQG